MKDERLVSKMEGKTNFSRRMKQFDGLAWLAGRPPPLILRQITPLGEEVTVIQMFQHWAWNSDCVSNYDIVKVSYTNDKGFIEL